MPFFLHGGRLDGELDPIFHPILQEKVDTVYSYFHIMQIC